MSRIAARWASDDADSLGDHGQGAFTLRREQPSAASFADSSSNWRFRLLTCVLHVIDDELNIRPRLVQAMRALTSTFWPSRAAKVQAYRCRTCSAYLGGRIFSEKYQCPELGLADWRSSLQPGVTKTALQQQRTSG